MPPRITRNHEYAKILARTVKDNRGFTSLVNTTDIIDSADVIQIASGISASSLVVYDTLDSLPTSSLTKGGQGYVKATQRLYISDSFGWYSAALVNLTPTQTLDPAGNVTLSTDGTSTIVTITATDSDQPESQLSYSVESDGNMLATGTTVTQDSSVFTITPLSEDNGGIAGSFTLTFKTTDNVNIATTTKDFSLAFTTPSVSGSAPTVALMKADGSSKTNSDITYYNSSNIQTGFTETGDPTASTFSPYRSGGYSYYGDGTGDYLYVDLGASGGPDADYTIEFWVYYTNNDTNTGFFHMSAASGAWTSNSTNSIAIGKLDTRFISYIGGGTTAIFHYNIDHSTLEKTWVHLALVRNSNAITLYINGVAHGTTGTQSSDLSSYRYLAIGGYYSTSYLFPGYIRDFRYVKGTAVYTSNFTPTSEPLTAITGTQFLLGGLPYFADQSSNGHSITINGDACLKPVGPYDYSPWTADDVGGSVYFDNTVGDRILTSATSAIGTSDFTIEAWVYPNSFSSQEPIICCSDDTSGDTNNWQMNLDANGDLVFRYNGSTSVTSTAGTVLNTWNHVAVTATGGTIYLWVNGKTDTNVSYSHNYTDTRIKIGVNRSHAQTFDGYIADARVIIGTAQYTSNFTPPTTPLSHTGSQTTLLMNNKSDANIYDVASAGRISLMGNANTNTSIRKFSTSSSVVHGQNGGVVFDELATENLGGDFTIQFWLYPTAWYNSGTVFGHWVGGLYHPFLIYTGSSSDWRFYASSNGSTWNLSSNGSVGIARWTNSWKHVACTYDESASTVKFWLDGTLASTFTSITGLASNSYTSSKLSFGSDQNAGYPAYSGYIQDIKVSRSVEYTGNFTPPTTEFEL